MMIPPAVSSPGLACFQVPRHQGRAIVYVTPEDLRVRHYFRGAAYLENTSSRCGLSAVAASWPTAGEEDRSEQSPDQCGGRARLMYDRVARPAARPCRAGVLDAEPGGGPACGAAERYRPDFIYGGIRQ